MKVRPVILACSLRCALALSCLSVAQAQNPDCLNAPNTSATLF